MEKIKAMAIVAMLSLSACAGPKQVEQFVEIKPNESAYVIPLEGSVEEQGRFDSETFLEKKKVATKRISVPTRKRILGRGWDNYEWIPTVKVIVVDRSPITFVWDNDKGVQVESKDSIGFSIGLNIAASIAERDTSKFLYHYPSGSLTSTLSGVVKAKSVEVLSKEFSKYNLEEGRQKKGEIVDIAKNKLIGFFEPAGITILTFGLTGGLQYDDKEIQNSINSNFKSELEIKNRENEKKAQAEVNLKDIGIAEAKKEAAKLFAQAAEEQAKMVGLEIKRIEAEALLEKAKRWDGKLPANIMPDGAGFIIDITGK